MSQYEDDAGMAGDALADMVEAGQITDRDALAYMAGDRQAAAKVTTALAKEEADGHR